ncbi:MAG: acyltransferase [Paramuribaculum sp.]|nr:acyltransferase [Paramuribaculum sp.]
MVVCLHTLPSGELSTDSRYLYYCVLAVTRPCVPLFLMITGFLLLRKQNAEIAAKNFWKKRIPRVLYPLLIWGVIYAVLAYVYDKSDFATFVYTMVLLPVRYPQEIGGILWYLYTLIGIYLFLPYLSPKTWTNKYYSLCFIGIWCIASFFTFLRDWDNTLLCGTAAYDYDVLLNFSGLLGYLILGCVLGQYYIKISYSRLILICVSLFLSGIALFFCGISVNHLGYLSTSYHMSFYSLPAILTASAIFLLFSNLNVGGGKFISLLSKLSFPIYLCHMVIYTIATRYLYLLSKSIGMMICVMGCTFIGATCLAWLINKMPYHKYITGA